MGRGGSGGRLPREGANLTCAVVPRRSLAAPVRVKKAHLPSAAGGGGGEVLVVAVVVADVSLGSLFIYFFPIPL